MSDRPSSVAVPSIGIAPGEFAARVARLQDHLQETGLSGAVLFDAAYILYFTGFAFIPTERPIAFVLNAAGEAALFVPRLEVEHARGTTAVPRVDSYVEYPGNLHPLTVLQETLRDMGIAGRIGADTDGYPWIFGYRGPALSQITGAVVEPVGGYIEDLLMIKSAAEIALIRESARWGNLAHRLLQRYTAAGAGETEVSARAGQEATLAMVATLGPLYRSHSMSGDGASAGYRGQIGRNAAIPHALANNLTFRAGDVLVSGAGAGMWGYHSELERTMIVGPASAAQRRLFDHMLALQEVAFGTLRPGIPCAAVDAAVRAYYAAHDLQAHWKHHTGHGIGLRYHEGPFLDTGDPTLVQPGMVFTVEPGLYAPELGGFRHSDTVVLTDTGIELLTYYPRDLDSLTIPV